MPNLHDLIQETDWVSVDTGDMPALTPQRWTWSDGTPVDWSDGTDAYWSS